MDDVKEYDSRPQCYFCLEPGPNLRRHPVPTTSAKSSQNSLSFTCLIIRLVSNLFVPQDIITVLLSGMSKPGVYTFLLN